ncbi:MAG TPA: glutathione synthase [Burkholderiaceae bacterium]|nr:glutathione synthase [Burkholderiaceae bacterium]
MRILIVADPIESFKTYKDSTYAIMQAAVARGHALAFCELPALWLEGGEVLADARDLELDGPQLGEPGHDPHGWWRLEAPRAEPLAAFDAVLMRKDPPFDLEYVYATWLLEHATRRGARVFNDPRAIRDHGEKYAIAEFPRFTADTIVTRDPARLRAFAQRHGEAVFKLLDGMGGASIFRARADDPNLSVIIETMNAFGARSVMAQRYLPQIADGDKRVLLIGGRVVPFALARVPKQGEARGNLAAGGTGRAQPLSARDREIAETLAPVLAARGLFLVGLDVIGECLTEINVTSPTCFREIAEQAGFDVAGLYVERLEAAVARRG